MRDGFVGPGKQPWVEHRLVSIQLAPGPLEYNSMGVRWGMKKEKESQTGKAGED